MGSVTPNLGLYKPDGTELVDEQLVFSANYDIIDNLDQTQEVYGRWPANSDTDTSSATYLGSSVTTVVFTGFKPFVRYLLFAMTLMHMQAGSKFDVSSPRTVPLSRLYYTGRPGSIPPAIVASGAGYDIETFSGPTSPNFIFKVDTFVQADAAGEVRLLFRETGGFTATSSPFYFKARQL